jgi:hypothetical protein
LNKSLAWILRDLSGDTHVEIVFLSGREDKFRPQTERWLNSHQFYPLRNQLLMRPTGDRRNDAIVKQELYEKEIKGKYNVLAVFDDRLRVCRMWHSLGLPLFRVGDPDSDF